jgi:hypothetical protein
MFEQFETLCSVDNVKYFNCKSSLKTVCTCFQSRKTKLVFISAIFITKSGELSRSSDGLDGRGLFPDRGKMFAFSTASRPALGPTQPPTQ